MSTKPIMKPSDETKQNGANEENDAIFMQSESHEIWKVAQRHKFVTRNEPTTQLDARTLKLRCYGNGSFPEKYATFKKGSLNFPKWITSFDYFEIDNKVVILMSDPPTPPQSDEEKEFIKEVQLLLKQKMKVTDILNALFVVQSRTWGKVKKQLYGKHCDYRFRRFCELFFAETFTSEKITEGSKTVEYWWNIKIKNLEKYDFIYPSIELKTSEIHEMKQEENKNGKMSLINICHHYQEAQTIFGVALNATATQCIFDLHPQYEHIYVTGGSSADSCVKIWKLDANVGIECRCKFGRIHQQGVSAIKYNSNGTMIASADESGTCYLWKRNERYVYDSNARPRFGETQVYKEEWNAEKTKILLSNNLDVGGAQCIQWANENNLIIAALPKHICIVNVESRNVVHTLDFEQYIMGFALDPYQRFIAVHCENKLNIYGIFRRKQKNKKLYLDEWVSLNKYPNSNKLLFSSKIGSLTILPDCSPDGLFVACGGRTINGKSNGILIFNRGNFNKNIFTFELPPQYGSIISVKWNPKLFASNINRDKHSLNDVFKLTKRYL
eukprot:317776_1